MLTIEEKFVAIQKSVEQATPKVHEFLAAYYKFQKNELISCKDINEAMHIPAFSHDHYVIHGFESSELIATIQKLIECENVCGVNIAERIIEAGKKPFKFDRIPFEEVQKLSRSSKNGDDLNLDLLVGQLCLSKCSKIIHHYFENFLRKTYMEMTLQATWSISMH